MSRTDSMMAAVQQHLRGTAFVFTRHAKGFDISLDLENPTWWVVLKETRVTATSKFSIITDEIDSKFTIIETPQRIEWADGTPRFAPQSAVSPKQSLDAEIDLRVSAEPIRRYVRLEGENMGFNESFERSKLVVTLGVAAAGVVAVGLVVMVLVNTMQGGS